MVKPHLIVTALSAVLGMALVPVLVSSVSVNEATIGIARIVIALFFLTPIIFARRLLSRLTLQDWLSLLIVGLFFGGHWWTYFYSIKQTTASLGAIAVSTYGIHLMLLNWLVAKKHLSLVNIAAVAVCFVGCILAAPELNIESQMTQGFLSGVLSGLLYASLPLLHKRIRHLSTMTRTWGQFSFAGILFLFAWPYFQWPIAPIDLWYLLILGVVCTLIAHGLWVKASTELPSAVTSTLYYFYIPIAMTMSAIFLEEKITPTMLLGAAMIVGASITAVFSSSIDNSSAQKS